MSEPVRRGSFRDLIAAMFRALGRAPSIEYVDMPPSIRDQYQYFTQAKVENLRRAGYNAGFTPLEAGGQSVCHLVPDPARSVSVSSRSDALSGGSAMFNFEDALKQMSGQTVLCVGDLMLDEFVYGEVARISPEAPAPVLAVTRSELAVGGAGNVARNIAALGARCVFVGVVGDDDAGHTLAKKLDAEPSIEAHLVVDPVASDHAQGPLRLGAPFDPFAASGLGVGEAGRWRDRAGGARPGARGLAAGGQRGALRLRQGRADGARCARR